MNENRWKIGRFAAALLLSLAVSLSAFAPAVTWAETTAQTDEVRSILEQYHLSDPGEEALNEGAIDGMIDSLNDPYTEYFTDEEWKSFSSSLEQTFTGLGIVMIEEEGAVYVEDVIPGSSAETAGVQPGDTLLSAEGVSLKGMSVAEIQMKLKGKEGTAITLGVTRDGKALSYLLVRKTIQLPVASAKMMGEGVGYLSLSGFTSDAGSLFSKQLGTLEAAGMKALVVDLRDNGGGYVNAAQQIAGLFIEKGVLAHMKDRNGKDVPLTVSGGKKPYPVTLLVNGHSASASELLAGAFQDYGVAKLVGTKTYGKGVVQSIIPLQSGGVLKVTVQEYFTPHGRKVDKTGLTPETVVEGAVEQLITAFRQSGGKQLSMTIGKGSVMINGVRSTRPASAVLRGKSWFVNLRLAALLAGAQVGYDKKSKSITVSKDGTTYKLSSGDSRLINKNGWSLVDLASLKQWFPGLSSNVTGGQLTMTTR
jgi:carboxyl-terminal processing protease